MSLAIFAPCFPSKIFLGGGQPMSYPLCEDARDEFTIYDLRGCGGRRRACGFWRSMARSRRKRDGRQNRSLPSASARLAKPFRTDNGQGGTVHLRFALAENT